MGPYVLPREYNQGKKSDKFVNRHCGTGQITGPKPKCPNKNLVAMAKELRPMAQNISFLFSGKLAYNEIVCKAAKAKIENGISTRRRE